MPKLFGELELMRSAGHFMKLRPRCANAAAPVQ
jgi:hypothetical protein